MGVTVQGGKSLRQLLKTGSLKAAAGWIQDLQAGEQVGKSPAEMSLPQAIMQSDK